MLFAFIGRCSQWKTRIYYSCSRDANQSVLSGRAVTDRPARPDDFAFFDENDPEKAAGW